MAAENRLLGKDLQVFNIDGSPITGVIRECSVEIDWDTQENKALLDLVHFDQPVIESWRITFRTAVDAVDFNPTGLANSVGATVAVTVDIGPFTYSATPALLKSMTHSVPDGLQEMDFTITNQGVALTIA